MIQLNLFTKQEQLHRYRKQTGYQREKWEEEVNEDFGFKIYTLLWIKQINSKDPPYGIGNHIQQLVIIYNGKTSEKEYV